MIARYVFTDCFSDPDQQMGHGFLGEWDGSGADRSDLHINGDGLNGNENGDGVGDTELLD